jgi:hypothetical protein
LNGEASLASVVSGILSKSTLPDWEVIDVQLHEFKAVGELFERQLEHEHNIDRENAKIELGRGVIGSNRGNEGSDTSN